MTHWLSTHKFEVHLASFSLMIGASIGLYFAANSGKAAVIWALIGVFAVANLLAMVVK